MSDALYEERLERAIGRWRSTGLISGDQAERLLVEEREREDGREPGVASKWPFGGTRPDPDTIVTHAACLLIVYAVIDILWRDPEPMSRGMEFSWALFVVAGCCGAGFALRRFPRARLGGNLLIFAGTAVLPILIYTLQRFAGFWPDQSRLGYEDYSDWELFARIVIELVSMVTAVALAWRMRFPPMLLLAGLLGCVLAIEFGVWIRADYDEFLHISDLWAGVVASGVIVGAGLELARRRLRSYAHWLLLAGNLAWLALFGGIAVDGAFSVASVILLLVSLASIVLSLATRLRVFLACGALGVYMFVSYLLFGIFDRAIPELSSHVLILAFIVLTGIGYQGWLGPALERWSRDVRTRHRDVIEPG